MSLEDFLEQLRKIFGQGNKRSPVQTRVQPKENRKMVIEFNKLSKIMGSKADVYDEAIEELFPKYGMTTSKRQAAFFAQVAIESGHFRSTVENLNYKATVLPKIFSFYKRNPHLATRHGRTSSHPADRAAIANHAYANRIGNGAPSTGDGWRFRGRGWIQVTGRENYTNFARYMGMTLDQAVEYLQTPKGAVESALWFWKSRNLNEYADKEWQKTITKRVNGPAMLHLNERVALYHKFKAILG